MDRQYLYDGIEHSIFRGETESSHKSLLAWMAKNAKASKKEAEAFVNGIIQEQHEREHEI